METHIADTPGYSALLRGCRSLVGLALYTWSGKEKCVNRCNFTKSAHMSDECHLELNNLFKLNISVDVQFHIIHSPKTSWRRMCWLQKCVNSQRSMMWFRQIAQLSTTMSQAHSATAFHWWENRNDKKCQMLFNLKMENAKHHLLAPFHLIILKSCTRSLTATVWTCWWNDEPAHSESNCTVFQTKYPDTVNVTQWLLVLSVDIYTRNIYTSNNNKTSNINIIKQVKGISLVQRSLN